MSEASGLLQSAADAVASASSITGLPVVMSNNAEKENVLAWVEWLPVTLAVTSRTQVQM